jgi:hypothetical protein
LVLVYRFLHRQVVFNKLRQKWKGKGQYRNTTKFWNLSRLSSQLGEEIKKHGSHTILVSLASFSLVPSRRNRLSLLTFSLLSLSLSSLFLLKQADPKNMIIYLKKFHWYTLWELKDMSCLLVKSSTTFLFVIKSKDLKKGWDVGIFPMVITNLKV